jgi:hypothetical protein
MYVVYDQSGTIMQTINGPDEDYGKSYLTPHGFDFIFVEGGSAVDPFQHYIDTETRRIKDRGQMKISVSDNHVSGIPHDALVSIECNGLQQFSGLVTDGSLEIVTDQPAHYDLMFSHPHFLPCKLAFNAD